MKSEPRTYLGATPEQWALVMALPLNQAGNTALFTVLGPLRNGFALDYSELGLVLGSYGLARFFMDLPAGVLARRVRLRMLLLVSLAANIVAAAYALLATAAWQVVLSRIIQGLASAVAQATILAWLVIAVSPHVRGRVMALSEACFSVVGLLVPSATGALAVLLNWRAAFAVAAVAGGLSCLTILVGTSSGSVPLMRDTSEEARATSVVWRLLSGGGSTLLAAYLLAFLIFFVRFGMANTLLPVVGSDQVGLTPLQIGFGLTLANLTGIAVLMFGGWAGDRFGRGRLILPGVLVLLACQLSLFFIAGSTLYFIILAAQGFGYLVNSFPMSLIGDALPPQLRSLGVAGYRLVADGAALLAPIAVGFAVDWRGFNAAKLLTVSLALVILIAIWRMVRPWPQSARVEGTPK